MKIISLFLILFSSQSFAVFQKLDMLSVYEVKEVNSFLSQDEEITGEAGNWHLLLAAMSLGKDFSVLKYCLFYRLPTHPTQGNDGILKWIEIPHDIECGQMSYLKASKMWNNISNLRASLEKNELKIEINFNGTRISKLRYIFYNMKLPNKKFELFSGFSTQRKMSGVVILSRQKSKNAWPHLVNPDYKIYRDVNLSQPCGGVTVDCTPISKKCDDVCASTWFWTPNGCPEGGTRYCGKDHCGEKGWPACLRGFGDKELKTRKDYRLDQSFVFCNEGLKPHPEGETILCY